ncbi:MAG: hypothetical protein QM715_03910 [Nibricoccus sp.]
MKTILTLIIVGALSLNSQANTNAVLRGIRVVETQDQLHPPRGKLGERGPYQFRRSTWRMHTKSSFDLAENREVANTVAKRHYAWIESQLQANGVDSSPYNVAMAWNAGVNAVIRGRVPAVARDYASRVLNIASTYGTDAPAEPTETATAVAAAETPASQPEAIATETPAVSILSPVEDPASATSNDAATNVVSTNTIPVEYVYTVPPSANDPVPVRFHTSPIMLAFHRPSPAEPVEEPAPAQVAALATPPFASDLLQTAGRM